jgi:choline dehydrogenase-like flavoprotein
MDIEADVVIIGSGMGGSVLALGLAEQGIDVVVVEQGTYLPREDANWDAEAVFGQTRYKPKEAWLDVRNGVTFKPGVHYFVGGSTKVYGASLARFREKDFEAFEHAEGTSPAWPFTYADLEPWYSRAEHVFGVHGTPGEDPTEPWRSSTYPYPALEHEPDIARLVDDLRAQGLHPSKSAMAVDIRPGGTCVRCSTCDGFPCRLGAKGDAERCAMTPALETGNVRLLDRTRVDRLVTTASGDRIAQVEATSDGEPVILHAKTFVVSAGAVNSAALLLSSASDAHPNGLANSSGLVGRNYMVHNATFLVAVDPLRKNHTTFQKTMMLNDWYFDSPAGIPLGNVQMLGRLQAAMIKPARPRIPTWALKYATDHSWDFYLESEDLPSRDNRVTLDSQHRIAVDWKPNNMRAHRGLVKQTTTVLRSIRFPIVVTETMGIETNSHQCGTAVAGSDPATSVLDQYCRTHDVENLLVVDSSYFPSSAAVNPALTIAAQALRVAYEGDVLR